MKSINWYIFQEIMCGGRSEKCYNYFAFMYDTTRKDKIGHIKLIKSAVILERIVDQSYEKFRKQINVQFQQNIWI